MSQQGVSFNMTTVTVICTADTDRELGYESDRMFQQTEIETLDQLAYFLAEVTRGMGFSYVDTISMIKDDGSEVTGYDFHGK